MRILVTGQRGFIGKNTVVFFRELGHQVFGFEGDITNPEDIKLNLDVIEPTVIIHLASYGNSPKHTDIKRIYQTIYTGTKNLLFAADQFPSVELVINAGTSSEYGIQTKPMSLSSIPIPITPYGISKLRTSQLNSRKLVSVRLFSVFGEYEAQDRLIPTLLKAARSSLMGSPATFHLHPGSHDFIYIQDVLTIFNELIEGRHRNLPKITHAASGIQTTNEQVVEIVKRVTNSDFRVIAHNDFLREYDSTCWVSDKDSIYLEPKYSLEEGLRHLWTN